MQHRSSDQKLLLLSFHDRRIRCYRCDSWMPIGTRMWHIEGTTKFCHEHDCLRPGLTVIDGSYQEQPELPFHRPELKVIQ